ncbi:MAG: efflux RND transporter permease subunit [Candidatus Pacearchaeota archaeon]|jgi:hypothetical protein
MDNYFENALRKIASFETKHYWLMLILFLIITAIAVQGMTKIEFQSDLSKSNPKDLEIVKINDRINSKFSEKSSPIIVLIEIDNDIEIKDPITDIRDPRVIEFIKTLEKDLSEESKIREVTSAGNFFPGEVPDSLEGVKTYLANIPGSENIFNDAYTLTPVFITTDLAGAEESKIREMNAKISKIIESSSKPGGLKVSITGEPPLAASIFRLIIQDAFFTLIAAIVLIFLMLLLIERSFSKSLSIMIPLLVGLIWTIGALGWFNLPISIGTAGLSAMLLGLGVEYSIFLFSRFEEEREKFDTNEAIVIALGTTGVSTLSSGLTTVIGFATLTFSIFPMLADMGFSLALGIGLILLSIMTVSPIVIIIEDKLSLCKITKRETKIEKVFDKYGMFVAKRPYTVIGIAIGITILLYFGGQFINSSDIDFNNVLPSDMPELMAFNKINNEFQETTSVNIYIELDTSIINSDEPIDIRDPRIVEYVDILSQKAKIMPYYESVNSISELEKRTNWGRIPQTLAEQKLMLEKVNTNGIISDDFSATIVRITLNTDATNDKEGVIKALKEIIETTDKPIGIKVVASGGIIMEDEFNKIIGPDSTKTAMYAFILIIALLLVLTRSIKYTILPLLTVVIALIWITGLIGYLGIPFNSITSSVLSMTIGVGIDFGIQISLRYKYEREKLDKKTALKETLKNTLYPLIITLIAALIGFRAMTLGQLKIMKDLGDVISVGVLSSMIVAITLISALVLVLDFKKDNKQETNKNFKNSLKHVKKEEVKPRDVVLERKLRRKRKK